MWGATPADLETGKLVADQRKRRLGTRPRIPVVVKPPGGLTHDEVQVSVVVEITQCGCGVTSPGQDNHRGVHGFHFPYPRPVPSHRRSPLPQQKIGLAITIQVTRGWCVVIPLGQREMSPKLELRPFCRTDVLK
jgi:hypothetical protein